MLASVYLMWDSDTAEVASPGSPPVGRVQFVRYEEFVADYADNTVTVNYTVTGSGAHAASSGDYEFDGTGTIVPLAITLAA